MNGQVGLTYIHYHTLDSQWELAGQYRELSTVLSEDIEGWDWLRGGGIGGGGEGEEGENGDDAWSQDPGLTSFLLSGCENIFA